jgi:hypothetical protein
MVWVAVAFLDFTVYLVRLALTMYALRDLCVQKAWQHYCPRPRYPFAKGWRSTARWFGCYILPNATSIIDSILSKLQENVRVIHAYRHSQSPPRSSFRFRCALQHRGKERLQLDQALTQWVCSPVFTCACRLRGWELVKTWPVSKLP